MKRVLVLLLLLGTTPAAADDAPRTLALGGDVMFGRMKPGGYVAHPATELRGWGKPLRDADLAFVNLETGICERGRTSSKFPLIWAPAVRLKDLKDAGVDIVSIANNHALDCGPAGLTQTVRELDKRRIAHVGGRSNPTAVFEELVVVAATMHPPPYRSTGEHPVVHSQGDDRLPREVKQLRTKYPDHAIMVSLHWGKERSKKVAAWQRALAAQLVHAGATIIAGHGSHTPQHVEQRGDALIIYSLGNLVFDDASPVGRPVPPRIVHLHRTSGRWRATLADQVATD